ncbi:GTP-binding protein HSR1-related protein [Hyella patelloides LEGE 07179]|uniref:GTP-binding protein HSR1-related protein n=1 Tax=Hyella patelloides LEGE 07179 TaxID=945734 RepID=A0A563VQB8_9CYAN|nr:GTPase [Hyella patelloides]VEP13579.1 GTP-binding protein HSR1-related protein [Hyella patelloides LEGE 07179]
MKPLKPWQLIVLAVPIALPIIFLLVAAGTQIHQWRLNWIWAIFILLFIVWRSLLVKWTKPAIDQLESVVAQIDRELTNSQENNNLETEDTASQQITTALQNILETSQNDAIIWEDWQTFLTRCQEVIVAVAGVYHPEVKRPLLNIYIPQAYGLIRGTVDDTDRWMAKLSPALNQVSIGQAYEAIETYQKLEPSARKLLKVWNWAQWVLNPAVAVANRASKNYTNQANQQLIANLNQLFRETALRNLCHQAIALYSGNTLPPAFITETPTLPKVKTQALREIIEQAESSEDVISQPINILLVGRTGAGKSSLINTIFEANLAVVDVLPSTDRISQYRWETNNQEALNLWDTPGYEQAQREDLRQLVLDYGINADLILLVTPALDPALQMDLDFLTEMQREKANIPVITIVTQVDRLRPIREWNPPYDWQQGETKKEQNIRNAVAYRQENLGEYCDLVLPLVAQNELHETWGNDTLSLALVEAIEPTKQIKFANFVRDRETKIVAAAKIIDRYTMQMSTTQGVTTLLKSPILQFLSTMTTGNAALAYALAEQIPVEQLPVVIGKLQMAYDLYLLLVDDAKISNFDFLSLWSLLLQNDASTDLNAYAFGHSLVEYWTQNLTIEELKTRFEFYLEE